MSAGRRKALAALALMGATAVLAKVGKPTHKLADLGPRIDLEAIFPREFGAWRVDAHVPVVLPAPDVQAKLNAIYNQVLSRTYVDARGYRIMLSVAYGGDQSDGMNIHLPEVCYPSQGFEVLSKVAGEVSIAGRAIPVHKLVTRLGGRIEPVTYWITIGDTVAPSRTQQKLVQIRYGLQGEIPDGMLVRVSSVDTDVADAQARQAGFIDELAGHLPPAYRARVVGKAGG